MLNRAGRPQGAKNVITTQVKDAIVEAASRLGSDGRGKDGLVGYLMAMGRDPATRGSFAALLGRVIPYQGTGPSGPTPNVFIVSKEFMEVM